MHFGFVRSGTRFHPPVYNNALSSTDPQLSCLEKKNKRNILIPQFSRLEFKGQFRRFPQTMDKEAAAW